MAKSLIWSKQQSGIIRGSCSTHIYKIEEDLGDWHLCDNQNGWDCFSTRVSSIEDGMRCAQDHFNKLVCDMEGEG